MTRRSRWALLPPALFLFILPVTHTTPLRLVLFGLAILATLATLGRPLRGRPPPKPLVCAIAFWFAVALAASIHSIDPSYSWGEFRNEVAITTVVFAMFWWLSDGPDAWRRWRLALLASFCLVSTIAIGTYLLKGDWLRASWVGDRNAYSTYVVLLVPFLLLLWTQLDGGGLRRAGIAVALGLALVSGAVTANRNMWFGVVAEVLVFAAAGWWHATPDTRRAMRGRMLAAAVVGIVLFAGVMAYVIHAKAIVSKTSTEEQARFDRDPRFEIWSYAATRIAERPLFGHGYGRGILRSDFRTHFRDPLKWHGHNIVVDAGLEAGVVGIVAVLGLFASLFWWAGRLLRSPDPGTWHLGAWSFAMLCGIVVKIMTDDILVRETSLLFWASLGIAFGLASRREPALRPRRPTTPG